MWYIESCMEIHYLIPNWKQATVWSTAEERARVKINTSLQRS